MSKVVQCDLCGKIHEIRANDPTYVEVFYSDVSNDERGVHKDYCNECFKKITGFVIGLKCMDRNLNIPDEMYTKIVKESSKSSRKAIDTSKYTYDKDGYLNKV